MKDALTVAAIMQCCNQRFPVRFALYEIQNGQLILHRKSLWQAGAPFAARQLVENPEEKAMPFLRECSQIQAEQLLAESCVCLPDKRFVQNLRAPFFKSAQNRLCLLPVREANGVFPLDERKVRNATVGYRKQQACLPEFAVAVIKQEISLSVDDRAVLIVLLAADAVAVHTTRFAPALTNLRQIFWRSGEG